jgi:hypothetical protein
MSKVGRTSSGCLIRLTWWLASVAENASTLRGTVRQHEAFDDRVSISVHVYGADIGTVRRHTYPTGGGRKPFVSGYSNMPDTPNSPNTRRPDLRDRSDERRRP